MIRTAVVDDLESERKQICAYLEAFGEEEGKVFSVEEFESGEAFLESYVPESYEIIFLDVYMDGMTGVDTARRIRELDDQTMIVFLTTSHDHMGDAFSIHAFDYVEKPIDRQRLRACLEDALAILPEHEEPLTFVSDGTEVSLPLREVLSVKSSGHHVLITRRGGRVYRARSTFAGISSQLENRENFLLVSRGILVNMDAITSFTEHSCCLNDGSAESITARRRKELVQRWHDYEFTKLHREAAGRRSRH